VPFLDIGYVFFWVPGLILAIAGYPLIFSWWSMLMIPITLVIYGFRPGGCIPAALRGYFQYATGAARRWR
jgi:hypothetical protein